MVDNNAPRPYIPSIRPYPQLPFRKISFDIVIVNTLSAPHIAISDRIVVIPKKRTLTLLFNKVQLLDHNNGQ